MTKQLLSIHIFTCSQEITYYLSNNYYIKTLLLLPGLLSKLCFICFFKCHYALEILKVYHPVPVEVHFGYHLFRLRFRYSVEHFYYIAARYHPILIYVQIYSNNKMVKRERECKRLNE